MKRLQTFLLSLGVILSPLSVFAHEGHGIVESGPMHYLFSPAHLLPALMLVAAGIWLARKMSRLGYKNQDFHA